MEHLRVRRAGFAYRRKFDVFLKRYEGARRLDFQIKNLGLSSSSAAHFKHVEEVVCCIWQIQTPVPSHLASLERRARWWSGSAGSTSGLLAKWVQNGTVRTALPTDNADTNTLKATSNRAHVLSFPFCCSTKIFIRHPRTLYATEDAFEKCKHELGECKSAVYDQCPVFASRTMIWFYALNLQRRGSRPNTKDTNKRVNSKSRKKPVSAATCDADETHCAGLLCE